MRQVEIWSRSPLGEYLWNHLLEGKKQYVLRGRTQFGSKRIKNLNFTYHSGFDSNELPVRAVRPNQNLVLVIDGSTSSDRQEAERWLRQVVHSASPAVVILVVLGSEDCDNSWILPLLSANGGPVDAVFIARDGHLDRNNDQILQMPLGVST